jgi:uncharacterized protein
MAPHRGRLLLGPEGTGMPSPTFSLVNRLADATSPYLLQHAGNPVDWHQWGPEALELARTTDRPILLSVGYAACHWCHVMERESFEDRATAELMNEHFVPIKVDREERPDIDAIYMDAVQAMTGQGGWPMTVFLTPDLQPFHAGTYFPPVDRHGLPGFPRLLLTIAELWRSQRSTLLERGRKVADFLHANQRAAASTDPLVEGVIASAVHVLERAHDERWGGFSGAPKFPQAPILDFLLHAHLRGYEAALPMTVRTLDRMAGGGLYDQLGGGFHRYSTDGRWLVPHFEKMLYDNAQLARVYLHAWQLTGRAAYRGVVVETLDYLLRELRLPDGGFACAQDADSEGVEGKFFTWSWSELEELGASGAYGSSESGNWEGTNVLWLEGDLDAARPTEDVRERLFDARAARPRPATDDKVLAAWNALAIVALAEAGRVLGEPRYVEAATQAAAFVLGRMRLEDGRLARSWRGRTSGPGFLDDHAGMAAASLALWETTFEPRWADAAIELGRLTTGLFADPRGGFFQTAADADQLLTRPKELLDNALPSGSSLAADVLQRLALLTGDAEFEKAGVGALRSMRDLMGRAPAGFGAALGALDLYLGPSRELAIVGGHEDRAALVAEAWRAYRPRLVLAAADPGPAPVPLLAGRGLSGGRAAAYVCERFACGLPVTSVDELRAQLG